MSNTGHGHVRPRPDGMRARCGGPAICPVCAREQEQMLAGAEISVDDEAQDEERALIEHIEQIKREFERAAKPYVDRLVYLRSLRVPSLQIPIV